jgi:hypothetical protein
MSVRPSLSAIPLAFMRNQFQYCSSLAGLGVVNGVGWVDRVTRRALVVSF